MEFSYTEIKNDIAILKDTPSKSEKVKISEKYSLNSLKANELKKSLYILLRDLRSSKNEFSCEDISDYRRLEIPEKTKLLQESIYFVKYYKEYLENKLKSKNLFDKIAFAKTRDWNYYMTAADKYIINEYLSAKKIIDDANPSKVVDKIYEKLINETKDFYSYYIESIKNKAEKFFDEIPSKISSLKMKIESNTDNKKIEKLSNILKRLETIFTNGKVNYVENEIKFASENFKAEMIDLANRFESHGIDESLSIKSINNDMKLFQMVINCKENTYFARAIIAAENSEKVSTHLRFIITK